MNPNTLLTKIGWKSLHWFLTYRHGVHIIFGTYRGLSHGRAHPKQNASDIEGFRWRRRKKISGWDPWAGGRPLWWPLLATPLGPTIVCFNEEDGRYWRWKHGGDITDHDADKHRDRERQTDRQRVPVHCTQHPAATCLAASRQVHAIYSGALQWHAYSHHTTHDKTGEDHAAVSCHSSLAYETVKRLAHLQLHKIAVRPIRPAQLLQPH